MGNDNYGLLLLFEQQIQSLLNLVFTVSIESTCCFIEKKDAWASHESSRNCYALLLSSRKSHTTLANLGFESLREQIFIFKETTTGLLQCYFDALFDFSI